MQALIRVVFLLAFLIQAPLPALAGPEVCRTPGGFVFGEERGIGGTGVRFGDRRGIGGTGISGGGDIGVYGRITGFGSVCVNGMEIEYTDATPVSDGGRDASVDKLQVGQVVALRVYEENGRFSAREIAIERLITGAVTRIDLAASVFAIGRQEIMVAGGGGEALAAFSPGDIVAVSGFRRADGVIVASHVEKVSADKRQGAKSGMFGGAKALSVQGFVAEAERGRMRLADGTSFLLPEDKAAPDRGARVIVFGKADGRGSYVADEIIVESLEFPAILDAGKRGSNENSGTPDDPEISPPELDVPGLPGDGNLVPDLPPVEVPDIPPVEVPDLPPVEVPDIPPVEVPDLPPVDVPDIPPVDVPDINLPTGP